MNASKLGPWGLAVIPLSVAAVLWIGWCSRRRWSSANDYLNASRSISLWAAALAFLAFNCGSIEVIAISAMAAQYGVQALHFYWVGGIPGLIFFGLFVIPIYMRTGARSLPEYLGLRFGPRVRLLNACISMVATICFAGVALYAIAQVLQLTTGLGFLSTDLLCAGVVLAYVLVGGVRGSIFTSVFQLFVMIAGLTPLLYFTVHFDASTWAHRTERWHLWKPLPLLSPHAMLDCFGVLMGLGFVISSSYWCTDFVMVQRALAAHTVEQARAVPLLAGFGKMGIAFLVVLPGVAAPSILGSNVSFDQTIPALMALEFGPLLLALGVAALFSGLMAWLAGNASGFSALWAEEVYRRHIRPGASEEAVIRAGRIAVPVCLAAAQLVAYATFRFHDIMEFLQLIVAFCYAPVFAAVLASVLSRRSTERGAVAGICSGIAASLAVQAAYWGGILHFGSQMTTNFYEAALSFSVALTVCFLVRDPRQKPLSAGIVILDAALAQDLRPSRSLVLLSATLLGLCLLLNLLWW